MDVPIHDGNQNILCASGSGDGETTRKIGAEGAWEIEDLEIRVVGFSSERRRIHDRKR